MVPDHYSCYPIKYRVSQLLLWGSINTLKVQYIPRVLYGQVHHRFYLKKKNPHTYTQLSYTIDRYPKTMTALFS